MFTLPTRKSKAFTLLELIVVIVILGILAAIAIPTFQKVIAKSHDSAAKQTVEAVLREAQALAAFRADGTFTEDDVTAAMSDLSAAGVGVSAARKYKVDPTLGDAPAADEVNYDLSADMTTASVVVLSESGEYVTGTATATGEIETSVTSATTASLVNGEAPAATNHLTDSVSYTPTSANATPTNTSNITITSTHPAVTWDTSISVGFTLVSGSASCSTLLNGAPHEGPSACMSPYSPMIMGEGVYTMQITDGTGTASVAIEVDQSAPLAPAQATVTDSFVSGPGAATAQWSWATTAGVDYQVTLFKDGVQQGPGAMYTSPFVKTLSGAGSYTISVAAFDAAGNASMGTVSTAFVVS